MGDASGSRPAARASLRYTNVETHQRGFKKPPLLGKEELDPEDMSLWGIYRLGVFFRRLGYGWIAPELRRFDVDGALFLSFEWQDYVDLGFTQSHVIKRILLQVEKRKFFRTHRDLPVTLVRRDRRAGRAGLSRRRRRGWIRRSLVAATPWTGRRGSGCSTLRAGGVAATPRRRRVGPW